MTKAGKEESQQAEYSDRRKWPPPVGITQLHPHQSIVMAPATRNLRLVNSFSFIQK